MAEQPGRDDVPPFDEARGEQKEGNTEERNDDVTAADKAKIEDTNTENEEGVTREDSKENTDIAGVGGADGMAATDSKRAPVVPGNTQASLMARAAPHQQQQQIPIQPYTYMFPQFPLIQNYMAPPPQNLTGQASLNPSRYTDAACIADPLPDTRRNRGGVTEPFPDKLHQMLEATEREGLGDIVGFFSHGRAFAIHKPRKFVQDIMPRFFNQSRLTSFQRQLNLYGFKRISQGPDNGGYFHELFLRGRKGLVVNMKRTKVKGTFKKKRDPSSEPNFYVYPPIGSSPPIALAVPQPALAPAGAIPGVANAASSPTSPEPGVASQHVSSAPYQMYAAPYFPFPAAQPMIARTPGPYTTAQQSTMPVYAIPPAAASPHIGQQQGSGTGDKTVAPSLESTEKSGETGNGVASISNSLPIIIKAQDQGGIALATSGVL